MQDIITLIHVKNVALLALVKNELQNLIIDFKKHATEIFNIYDNRDLYETTQIELIEYIHQKLKNITGVLDGIFTNIHISTDQQTLYTYSVNKQLKELIHQIKYTLELLQFAGSDYDNYTNIVIKLAICCENIEFYYWQMLQI